MEFKGSILLLTNGNTDGFSIVVQSVSMDMVTGSPEVVDFLYGSSLERVVGGGGVEHGAGVEFSGGEGVATDEA
jgi:hypothetical protein